MTNYSGEVQKQLKDSLEVLKSILGSDLLGVYLFASAVLGGLQKYSDLDLFVVTNRHTTSEEKTKFISHLLQIYDIYMMSSRPPIEMTIVEKEAINPWKYPPHFDFQYGEWLRESFEKGIIESWETQEMHDLDHDLDRLIADLEDDTRNVLLILARIWSAIETNSIRSKPAAAGWVISGLPERYQPVVKRAKSICIGDENEHWDDIKGLIKSCGEFMLNKIDEQGSLIDRSDKRITLAEAPR